jgi:hypothetical protein
MKISVLTLLFSPAVLLLSCSGANGSGNNDSTKTDSGMVDITRPAGENNLESFLSIKDEADLKSKFGADHVKYDTVWGGEGAFDMGTYLDKGTNDEVEILWKDSLHRSGPASISVHAKYNPEGNYNYACKWSSKTGVKLGMTTDELEKLNQKTFSFSGFGWDYGGGVMGWNNGKLEDSHVGVTLTEAVDSKVSEDEMTQILGDQEIRSDNKVVKKVQPRVVSLSVY